MSKFGPGDFLKQKEDEREGSPRRENAIRDAASAPPDRLEQEPLSPSVKFLKDKYDPQPDLERAGFDSAVDNGMKENAERASKILAIQEKTGLPRDMVERKIEELEPVVLSKSFDKRRFYNENPTVSKWIAKNPDYFPMVKEDLDRLSWMEKFWGSIFSSAERGALNVELSGIGLKRFSGTDTPEDHLRAKEIKARQGALGHYNADMNWLAQVPGYMAEMGPLLGATLGGRILGAGAGGAAGAVGGAALGSVVPGAGTVAGAVAGAKAGAYTGWRFSSGVAMGSIEAGLAFDELADIKDEDGNYIDKNVVRGASVLVGVANGALEAVGLSMITKNLPGIKKLSKNEMKRVLKTATTNKALMNALKAIGEGTAGEGVTEGLQETVNIIMNELLTKMHTGEFSDATYQQLIERIGESFKAGALGGGGIATTGATFTLNRDLQHARQAKKIEQGALEFGEVIKEVKVVKKNPEASQKLIKSMAKDETAEIYIPADSWKTYWQKKDIDPEDVAVEVLGEDGRKAYNEAIETGGDLAIPVEKYATELAPTEHNKFIAREMRVSPQQPMNGREADELAEEMDKADQEALKEQEGKGKKKEKQETATEKTDTIEDIVYEQLVKAGHTPSEAKPMALFQAEHFRTLGIRGKKEIQKHFEGYKLEIRAPESQQEVSTERQNYLEGEGVDEFFETQDEEYFQEGPTSNKVDVDEVRDIFSGEVIEKFDILKNYDYRTGKGHPLINQYIDQIKKDKRYSKKELDWVKNLLLEHDPKAIKGLKNTKKNEKLHKKYDFNFNLEFREGGEYLQWVAQIIDKKTGKKVGEAYGLFGDHNFGDRRRRRPVTGLSVKQVDINKKHQRKGLGKELYRTMVEKSGRPVIDVGRMRSEEGAAFRDSIRDNKVFYQESDSGQGMEAPGPVYRDLVKLRELANEDALGAHVLSLALSKINLDKLTLGDDGKKSLEKIKKETPVLPNVVSSIISVDPVNAVASGIHRDEYGNTSRSENNLSIKDLSLIHI